MIRRHLDLLGEIHVLVSLLNPAIGSFHLYACICTVVSTAHNP